MNKTMALAKLAASTLILSTTMVGCSMNGSARLANPSDAKAPQLAAAAAAGAHKALGKHQAAKAVTLSEVAVAQQPRSADYRMLLGQSYLAAGRFQSAEQSFTDALTLDPEREKAALNLALAQVALGKADAARKTLADYRDKLPASDFGLALALTGDVDEAVRVLEFATRAPDATGKTRQNLALAYALQGKWTNARVMAVQDLEPDQADARIAQWASFARPGGRPDQVAALLGVKRVDDAGQPIRLALSPATDVVKTAAAEIAIPAAPAVAPVDTAPADSAPVAFETSTPPLPAVAAIHPAPLSAPARQVAIVASPRPVTRIATAKARPALFTRPVASGNYLVQLGAFENAAVAEHAWNRDAGRLGLASYEPVNGSVQVGKASFVRLSVGGFARGDAERICARIKATGKTCFVRVKSGDGPARWVQRHTYRVAAR